MRVLYIVRLSFQQHLCIIGLFVLNSMEAIGKLSPEFTEKDPGHYIAFCSIVL